MYSTTVERISSMNRWFFHSDDGFTLYLFESDYEGYQALALYQGKRLVELLDTAAVSLHRITMYDRQDQYTYMNSLTLNVRKSSIDTLTDGAYTIVPVSFGKKQQVTQRTAQRISQWACWIIFRHLHGDQQGTGNDRYAVRHRVIP